MTPTPGAIPKASEVTMLANLPPAGFKYFFYDTDKNNNLYSIDSNGTVMFVALASQTDCRCCLAESWLAALNEALNDGQITGNEYNTAIALGFNATYTTNTAGTIMTLSVGSFIAPVTSVTMTGAITSTLTMSHTGTAQAGVTIAPINGNPEVIWVSSNAAKATVDQNGLITGVAAGTVTITVYSVSDPTKSSAITITVT